MKWVYQEICSDQLLWKDSLFDWSLKPMTADLKKSVETQGLLIPLLVQALDNQQFQLIDGFKRLRILESLTAFPDNAYPCWIIPQDIPRDHLILLRVQGIQQSFTGMEICQILDKLKQLGIEESFLIEQILPKLGLKPSQKMMQDLLRLHALVTWNEVPFLANHTPEELLPLLHFSKEDILVLGDHLKDLPLGGNKWKTLLLLFKEVSRRQGVSLSKIIKIPEVVQILCNPQLQPPVRFRLLKQQLETWRYPELTAAQADFEQAIKALQLPPQSSIEYDPFFEKDELLLKIQAGSFEELKQQLVALGQCLHTKTWEKLFQLLHGD